jgi:8-oxo-dGTP pyrophosphatase MutT (NUDIX family)
MHRNLLRNLLIAYTPQDQHEQQAKIAMLDFLNQNPTCFNRDLQAGHFTASCWLLNPTADKVLLTQHAKLGVWLQLGGHCDGDSNILNVALREAEEESGLKNIVAVSDQIFDIDIHKIPAHKNEATHLHYDVRFLLQAQGDDRITISDESKDLQWFSKNMELLPTRETSILRMFNKWLASYP